MKIDINIIARTASPLHITSPAGKFYFSTDTGRPTRMAGNGNFPLTRTRTFRVALSQDAILDDQDRISLSDDPTRRPNRYEEVPGLPSNSLRGRLRRVAAHALMDKLQETDQPKLSLDSFHGLTCGAVTGNPGGDNLPFAEIEKCLKHPHVGLFGGGPHMIKGRVKNSAGYPLIESCALLVPRKLRDIASNYMLPLRGYEIIGYEAGAKKDDALGDVEIIGRYVANAAESLTNWLTELNAGKTARKAASESGDKGSQQRGLSSVQFTELMIPGIPLAMSFSADTTLAGPEAAGLFLHSVGVAFTGSFGGKSSLGYGRLEVLHSQIEMGGKTIDGAISSEKGISTEDPVIVEALQAWEKARPLSADIESIYKR